MKKDENFLDDIEKDIDGISFDEKEKEKNPFGSPDLGINNPYMNDFLKSDMYRKEHYLENYRREQYLESSRDGIILDNYDVVKKEHRCECGVVYICSVLLERHDLRFERGYGRSSERAFDSFQYMTYERERRSVMYCVNCSRAICVYGMIANIEILNLQEILIKKIEHEEKYKKI